MIRPAISNSSVYDVADALDMQSGTAQNSAGMSISSFLASFGTALVFFGGELLLFLVLKGKLPRIYQPKTYLVPDNERTFPSPTGLFRWILPVFCTPSSQFIHKCGLDAYFFLRYLRMLLKIFVPLSVVVPPILLPLNKIDGKDDDAVLYGTTLVRYNVTGLDQLSWANIKPENANRYWVHLLLAILVVVYVCFVFFHEFRTFIRLRREYLTSPRHRLRASATTVLVACIPQKLLSVRALEGLLSVFPGGVRNIWINRNMDELSEKIRRRNAVAQELEKAETRLIVSCKKAQVQMAKSSVASCPVPGQVPQERAEVGHSSGGSHIELRPSASRAPSHDNHQQHPYHNSENIFHSFESDSSEDRIPLWKKYLHPRYRETMRIPIFGWSWMPVLPFVGKKVDKIDALRCDLARLNLEIEIDQQSPEKYPFVNSAFVQFNLQIAAHMACQSVVHKLPNHMSPRIVEISPDDIIWDNMSIRWWERYLRNFVVHFLVFLMIIGWTFPVAFAGLLTQLTYLGEKYYRLSWLRYIPSWVRSLLQGVLPSFFLAVLIALLPIALRFLSLKRGLYTGMSIELAVQKFYYIFQFIQVFLVVSISASFTTMFRSFTNLFEIPAVMAENVPVASNYFFSYTMLQALSVSASALVQIVNLISWFVFAPLFDVTARMKWSRTTNLSQIQWGTFFPVYSCLGTIGLIYSIISPLILFINVVTFFLFWFVHRYNTLYVMKFRFDTGGLLFPRAINQLFTGLYVMELCLIGLFFLVHNERNQRVCVPHAVITILVFLGTLLYQHHLNKAFDPLLHYIPIDVRDGTCKRDGDFTHQKDGQPHIPFQENDQYESSSSKSSREEPPMQHVNNMQTCAYGKSGNSVLSKHTLALNPSAQDVPASIMQMRAKLHRDIESQNPVGLGSLPHSGLVDRLENLTQAERDSLFHRAFQHEALRTKRPVIWIPRDDIGVSDDEIFDTQAFSKYIWISNEYQTLDGRCKPIFSRSPPDFSKLDLIQT